jgi:hypothetical protein
MANGREISFPTDTEEKARLVVHFYEQIKLVLYNAYSKALSVVAGMAKIKEIQISRPSY